MECENTFCVYWKKDRCALSSISLDILGRCRDCILLDFEDRILEAKRQEMLEDFERARLSWTGGPRRSR